MCKGALDYSLHIPFFLDSVFKFTSLIIVIGSVLLLALNVNLML